MPQEAVIELKGIKKVYSMGAVKVLALNSADLKIAPGEMVAVMGSSGSGKSTLLNIIGCLDKPTEGIYNLNGKNVSQMSKNQLALIRNREIGFIFQGFNLLGRINVRANVQLPLIYAGADKKEMESRAREALDWVGLSGYLDHYPNQMSGGQQQRVAIARALIGNPSLVLADEPTGALDSKTSIEIISVIQRLNQEKGITVIMVTHEREVAHYCRRLIQLKDGRVINDTPLGDHRSAARDLELLPAEQEVRS